VSRSSSNNNSRSASTSRSRSSSNNSRGNYTDNPVFILNLNPTKNRKVMRKILNR
jgi:hypothetical protein